MEQIRLPAPSLFNLDAAKCLEIAASIRSVHLNYPPVRIPPPIISAELKEQMQSDGLFLTHMMFSVVDRVFAGSYIRLAEELRMTKHLGSLIERLSKKEWITRAKKFYRPDFLLTKSGLCMVENNIDTPLGGIGICDRVIEKFQNIGGITVAQLKKQNLYSLPLSSIWIAVIQKLLSQKKSITQRKPVFYSAYHSENVNPEDDFTSNDYNETITGNGFDLLLGPITHLSVKDNKVSYKGTEVDVIYTDFSITEFIENKQPLTIIHELIDADEKGNVLFLSPPASMIVDNKAILSFLTEDKYRDCFTAAEWQRLSQLIPETRIVKPDEREFCLKNKAHFVLKPGFDFGGRNVFFGAEQDDQTWESMIDQAIDSDFPTVIQRLVTDQVKAVDEENNIAVNFCLGPLFFDEIFAGCLYRESVEVDAKHPIINATRGSKFSATYFSL